MHWFRGGLVCKAHRRLYLSTPGVRVIKKKKKVGPGFQTQTPDPSPNTLRGKCKSLNPDPTVLLRGCRLKFRVRGLGLGVCVWCLGLRVRVWGFGLRFRAKGIRFYEREKRVLSLTVKRCFKSLIWEIQIELNLGKQSWSRLNYPIRAPLCLRG